MMERRKARAEQRGETVPEWADELDFLNDARRQPMDRLAAAVVRLRANYRRRVLRAAGGKRDCRTVHGQARPIAGIGQATGRPLHDADELTSLSAAKVASAQAYEMAGWVRSRLDWPKFTTVSPSLKSWPARTWGSSRLAKARTRLTRDGRPARATGPSTPAAA